MLKVGVVYTGTTPQLIELVEKELKNAIPVEFEMVTFKDPTIIEEANKFGYVTTAAASRLVKLFLEAIDNEVDIILNACSSVGEVVDNIQPFASYLGVPIVRIDEYMCRQAAINGSRIGVLATLPTTMEPTKQKIKSTGREIGKNPVLVDGLVNGAFGLDEEQFKAALLTKVNEIKSEVDVIVLAQGSMAYAENYLSKTADVEVLSSPRFGALAIANKLKIIGKLEEV